MARNSPVQKKFTVSLEQCFEGEWPSYLRYNGLFGETNNIL